MDGEDTCVAARKLLQRCVEQFGARALPEEILRIQDVLECVEKNADRVAHMMKDPRRKRTGESWDDIKGLLVQQDQYFKQITELFRQLATKRVAIAASANSNGAP